jgi:type II secretory pathway predicted ATPase ExeA
MYEAHFGLNKRPFASVPCIEQYFPGTAIDGALQVLTRCIQRAEGAGLVVGPSGTGKTLLCLMLKRQFQDSLRVVLLSGGHLGSRRTLFQAILFHLGQPYRGMDEGELRLAILEYLAKGDGCAQGVLLLVDEAHVLTLRLLDELRMMTNLVVRGQSCVRLVLVGGAALEERLASPKLESFSQRIAARCYLESLTRDQTQEYLQTQVTAAGGAASRVFAPEVAQAVFAATDGVPRLINQLCDHALLLAYSGGRRQVQPSDIEEAWADLQQLPTPWNAGSRKDSSAPGVIEFGSGLDDEPSEAGDSSGSQTGSVPMLRVAGELEDSAPEPAQQVARIQQALVDMHEDFQPAGSIGPEVELVFDDLSNPFGEAFEEEQIVIDRYANLSVGRQAKGDSPHLREAPGGRAATEGWSRQTGADPFSPALSFARQGDLSVDASAEINPPEAAPAVAEVAGATVEFGSQLPESESPAANQSVPPSEPAAAVGKSTATGDWESEPGTVPLRPSQQAAEQEEGDLLLVVEDGYDDADTPLVQPPATVRRQEYRQLFARLRRSS